MLCQNCKKQINKPLELYNGDWACPVCKMVLNAKSIAVSVTADNDETFRLSELCYMRALNNSAKGKNTKNYDGDIATAIDYCRTSARMGNPKALIRLGYYYEYGYLTADRRESFILAGEYYRLAWETEPSVNIPTSDEQYIDGCKKLRNVAARRYLELLKKMPDSMRRAGDFNYRDEKRKIALKGLAPADDVIFDELMEEDRVMRVMSVLDSCFAKERAPLFGIMRIERGQLGELLDIHEKDAKQCKIVGICKKVNIVLFNGDNGTLQIIKTADDCKKADIAAPYWLYFFNGNGVHEISERKCSKIGKALKKANEYGEYGGVKRIIDAVAGSVYISDCVFGVDDVLMYKSRPESFEHATYDLIYSLEKKFAK